MYVPPDKRSTSTMSHLGLMLSALVLATMLTFALVIGWRWYFGEVEHRRELARLSLLADEHMSQQAAVHAAQIKESTRAATTLPEPPSNALATMAESQKPGVSLTNLPGTQTDGEFSDPVPIQEEVSPERLAAAKEVQQQFWAATHWEDKLKLVADAERVRPLLRDYYEVQKNHDPVAGNATHQAHFKLNNTEVLLFSYSSPRPGGTLDMALTATDGGPFAIDWESYVGSGEVAWGEFKKGRSTKPALFRVFANQDDYFNYEFTDEKRYLSFHLGSADGFYFLKGYCERDSKIGSMLTNLFASGAPRLALTLRLAFPEEAKSDHCVRIVGVVANRWLLVP